MDKTAQLVVGVLLVAFVIERVTAAIAFFIEDRHFPERKRKLLLIGINGLLAALALWKVDILLLRDALNVTRHPRVDLLLTWLIIVGGADRISTFIGSEMPSPSEPPAKTPPTEVRIFIEERDGKITEVTHEVRAAS
jgi:prepilin signal peptidase PulO-like enzyme (type II secretory pathway)